MIKVRILCIDDDEGICYALSSLFETRGWESYSAPSVEKGLELFKGLEPDIVLIDYHMPGINGAEGVKLLRELSEDVPIIVFTIEESQEVADEFLKNGATDFALKPIKAPDLISRINLHIRLLAQSRETAFVTKGINKITQELIISALETSGTLVTARDISTATGLAYQTVYRYLQYLTEKGRVVSESVYGKIGRPRQMFRIAPGKEGDKS